MYTVNAGKAVPVFPLEGQISMHRSEGDLYKQPAFLNPHRKDYYLFVFVKQGDSRHWVDMKPYVLKDNTLYFTTPHQVHLKEEPKPVWGTSISFTREFMTLQQNEHLHKLPIILNPHNGHELMLSQMDAAFLEDILDKLYTEYCNPGQWQQRMLCAYLHVMLTYLSRLYTEQFTDHATTSGRLLLKRYQEKVEELFQQLHEVGDYAALLNISAGHLSEVVKAQSGKPAIAHIHDRIILEARRLLFHTESSVKEIAFDLGFSDASYFGRFFKNETGLTPAGYRTGIRKIYH